MKSIVRASKSKQFEYMAEKKEGIIQRKYQPEAVKYYLDFPWLWIPTGIEEKKGKRIRIVCRNCGFEVVEMSILSEESWRTKWWDWELRSMVKDGKWFGILDHNINLPTEWEGKKLAGRSYLPIGYMTVSCCCGNSERDKLKLLVNENKKLHKGFKIRFL